MTHPNFDKFRFYVTDDAGERWSDVWFVEGRAESVYLASRKLGGSLKLSLHPRGISGDGCDCQFGHPFSYAEKELAAGNSPMPRLRWTRPQASRCQFVQIARVLFPTDYLGRLPKLESDQKLKIAFPRAPAGSALEVSVFCSVGNPDEYEADVIGAGFTPVTYYPLGGEEYASIVARHVRLESDFKKDIEKLGSSPAHPLLGAPARGQTIENARGILIGGKPENGEALCLTEIGPLRVKTPR